MLALDEGRPTTAAMTGHHLEILPLSRHRWIVRYEGDVTPLSEHPTQTEARAEAAAERDRRMAARQAEQEAEHKAEAARRAQHASEPTTKRRRGPADNLDADVDLS